MHAADVYQGHGIVADAAGNIYVTGFFTGTADFDPGPDSVLLTSEGLSDVFIAKYDKSGKYIFARAFGGIAPDSAFAITLNSHGNIFITGSFQDVAKFGTNAGSIGSTLTGTNSNDVFIAKYDVGLPVGLLVQLLSFHADAIDKNRAVRVTWSTASEVKNAYFEVERSKDGVQFESIAKKPGCLNCTGIQQYEFLDNFPYSGISYYRLKQVDIDHTFTFSRVAEVNIADRPSRSIQVYPNITNGPFVLQFNNNQQPKQVTIRVFGVGGTLVSEQAAWLIKWNNSFPFNLAHQPRGVYYVNVADMRGTTLSNMAIIRR